MTSSTTRTPLQAIRAKCLDCSGGQVKEVRLCPIKSCPLYVFRMGRNPRRKRRVVSEATATA
jgi:hypothetical protein